MQPLDVPERRCLTEVSSKDGKSVRMTPVEDAGPVGPALKHQLDQLNREASQLQWSLRSLLRKQLAQSFLNDVLDVFLTLRESLFDDC